jgi:hypothetical protein
MTRGIPDHSEMKMLPGAGTPPTVTPATNPSRQLSELPKDELEALAEDFGLDPTRYKSRQHLVAGIHDRRQMIAGLDREAMLDVVMWGRRPVTSTASKEQIAHEIARIQSMKFSGLSQRGLVVLARMRSVEVRGDESVPLLIKRLKRKEGFFTRMNRKRRAWIGGIVSNMIGEGGGEEYQFLPPQAGGAATTSASRGTSIKDEIEEAGLIGGITGRIKKSADAYLNQKLDEIEARIDRKLDEIDRRLAEWRDKEVANRIRILKITLWASVIVSAVSLIYLWLKVYIF